MSDIFDFNFDKLLNKPIDGNATGVVYDTVENALNTGSILQGGNLTLKTLSIGGLVRQVAPGDDINAAIDAVNREGGGTVQLLAKTYTLTSNINMKSNVALVGAGIDVTVLDFVSQDFGIVLQGTNASPFKFFSLRGFTIKNSAAATSGAAIRIAHGSSWSAQDIKMTTNTVSGMRVTGKSQDWLMINCIAESNTGATTDGFQIHASNGDNLQEFSLINCTADSNGRNGFSIDAQSNDLFYGSFVACRAASNSTDGFNFAASGSSALDTTLTNCVANSNTGIGFDLNSLCQRVQFVNCIADQNSNDGFEIDGIDFLMVGCNSQDPVDINTAGIIVGCHLLQSGAPTTDLSITESDTISYLNQGESPRTIRRVMQMQNGSGSALRTGDVVIFASDADGETVTTTTTAGDDKVFGVVDESIASTSYGRVHIEGYSTLVKVSNIAASIAIGDFLSTFSAAYYAQKAAAGDQVFAIALEAPTTGTAQIDALLISPRLI